MTKVATGDRLGIPGSLVPEREDERPLTGRKRVEDQLKGDLAEAGGEPGGGRLEVGVDKVHRFLS